MASVTGRLALTWVNKDKALIGAGDGGYEWAPRDDPRVTEVRLLHEVGDVGEAADNLLIEGDSAHALRALLNIPEYAAKYRGKVKLVYIDPPFNTGQAFAHYDDALEHSIWLGMMRERLVLIRDLLSPDGSVWVHLDHTEAAYCRALMDEIFGRDNFRNAVVWKRTTGKSSAVRGLGTLHEVILFYARSPEMQPNRILLPYDDEYLSVKYSSSDAKGKYRLGDLTAPGIREGHSGRPWQGMDPSAKGRHWVAPNPSGVLDRLPPDATTQQKLDLLLECGYVQLPRKIGQWPQFKRYLNESGGVALGDLWTDIPVLNSQEAERNGFSTQKPERLIERIIEITTKPGDVVLDCFGGSGTTAAVAHKMNRQWILVELLPSNLTSFIQPRLTKIVNGEDPSGITQEVVEEFENTLPDGVGYDEVRRAAAVVKKMADANAFDDLGGPTVSTLEAVARALRYMVQSKKQVVNRWSGGGGFRIVQVGPSMYEFGEGRVFLSEWATNGRFAEAVCAQLGFAVEDAPPFAGRKGRTRLAVVDGVADEGVIAGLVSRLADGERMVLVAKAVTEDAAEALVKLSPGSKLKKAPRDVLIRKGRVSR
ncbi:site-specific DNA-methyltransferase [Micromonospora sp. WMMD1082]|uniref:site-specific DNA-methyltransferase n=1 Tax=Micromonospora sp. WMMD1082 TaxID=3016104 RepID=UPI0024169ED3|nr:site-specific DNA-methyltransferase [Micromonospora sp. WMMD1082]MDG4793697.1 site-specific DNA-methyltransferase [Micromonospora sp. WMMD1082]